MRPGQGVTSIPTGATSRHGGTHLMPSNLHLSQYPIYPNAGACAWAS